MIDFHSHILPGMDDGAKNLETSLEMLRESRRQGVTTMVSTSHFYGDEESPTRFLSRRSRAWETLSSAMKKEPKGSLPNILLGAEVLYFPGMGDCDELEGLIIQNSRCILLEPPMMLWSRTILDDMEQVGYHLGIMPVIAHLDRYMWLLREPHLIHLLEGRRFLIQVNANFFLHEDTRAQAITYMNQERIHLIGSDCHNLEERHPNLGEARSICIDADCGYEFDFFRENAEALLHL